MELRCAGNGDNPRLLCEQLGQSDLRRCHLLLCGELSNHIHERLIRLAVFLAEARDFVAEILTAELGVLVDCPREETPHLRVTLQTADALLILAYSQRTRERIGTAPAC